jgi:hypothetical protein
MIDGRHSHNHRSVWIINTPMTHQDELWPFVIAILLQLRSESPVRFE